MKNTEDNKLAFSNDHVPDSEPINARKRAAAAAGQLHGGPPDLAENHDAYLVEAYESQ